jgi:hypothetical protein
MVGYSCVAWANAQASGLRDPGDLVRIKACPVNPETGDTFARYDDIIDYVRRDFEPRPEQLTI